MLPELGQYSFTVLSAYGVTAILVGGLVVVSLRRSARVKRELAEAENARRARREA